jgi:hypothetical protein
MSMHVSWSSIGLLHNVATTLAHLEKLGQRPFPRVSYKAKVKLHGKNTAVQITSDGLVVQSRTDILSATSDLNGFAKWVAANESHFTSLPENIVVFGEWVGPGIEKGMAASQIPAKIFAIFAIQTGRGEHARVVYDPAQIEAQIQPLLQCSNVHVLPWEQTGEIVLDYGNKEQMESMTPLLNELVDRVEKEDPWIKRTFGFSGLGEGLVFYPEPAEQLFSPEELALLMFKAKGEKHRTAGTKQAVQIAPEVVENTAGFVQLMVTEARLEQGVSEACEQKYEVRNMSKFLNWVLADVQKESAAELQAAGLDWKQVGAAVQRHAREWYKARCV